jgi:hypothetical protein
MNHRLPEPNKATVSESTSGYVVTVDNKIIAGPFRSHESAWHWIDRNERYTSWQRDGHLT